MSRKDTLARAGVIKISYKVVIPCPSGDTVFGNTGLLENKQEWHMMSEAYHKDPCAGYRGAFLTIPKGVTVVVLRMENPAELSTR